MSTEKNKAILRQFLEAWNPRDGGDWKVCAEDCIFHGVAGEMSVERMQQVSSLYFGAFPDLLGTIEDLVAEGDKVVSRETWRGTHEGEFMGIAPTGKQMNMKGVSIVRILGGRIAEYWTFFDRLALMEQLGAAQPPGGGGG